jgi:hypothetical protein
LKTTVIEKEFKEVDGEVQVTVPKFEWHAGKVSGC